MRRARRAARCAGRRGRGPDPARDAPSRATSAAPGSRSEVGAGPPAAPPLPERGPNRHLLGVLPGARRASSRRRGLRPDRLLSADGAGTTTKAAARQAGEASRCPSPGHCAPPTLPRAPGKLRAPISVERPGWGSGPGGGRSSRLHEADCSRGFWNLPATRGAHARGDQPAPRGRAGPQAAARTHLRTWQTVARAPGTEARSRPQSGARRVRGNRSPAVARFQARGHGFAGASPRSPYPARVWAQQRSREGRSPWRSRRSCYYRGWAAGALRRLRLCPCRRKPTVPVTRDAPGLRRGQNGACQAAPRAARLEFTQRSKKTVKESDYPNSSAPPPDCPAPAGSRELPEDGGGGKQAGKRTGPQGMESHFLWAPPAPLCPAGKG